MENHLAFSKSIFMQVVMEVGYYSISALHRTHRLIAKVVNLLLVGVATDSEEGTFSRRLEKDGSGLLRVSRIVHLQTSVTLFLR